tara:strand:+ start:642 stop:1703 length:1062 start_codon:yes stop_codon:yes gene_type:complete
MATVTKTVLKTYFEQGDIPTQGQYVDLIDSQFGLGESGTQIIEGTISASSAEIEYITLKKLYLPGNGIASMKIGTTFAVGKTLEVTGDINTIGNISASGNIIANHITASGNIEAAKYHSIGRNMFRYKSNWSASILGQKDEDTLITGSTIQLGGKLVNGTSTVTDCHVTASANFSASGVITGNGLTVTGNSSLTGSLIVGENTTFGNATTDTHTFTGNITASNAVFTSTVRTNATITASLGINATDNAVNTNVTWSNTGTQSTARRTFTLTISSLPAISIKNNFTNEYMVISNSQITATSVVIVNSAAFVGSGEHTQLMVSSVRAGLFKITPYSSTITDILAGGSATYNFVIL